MQIAKIVPKVKTSSEGVFDYAIPPEILPQIKLGILVEVPFHGRKLEGIIIDIKKSSKVEKLKNIIRILDPIPVIDEIHIELAKWMADYYITSLGQTLFENIVPPAIRTIKKQSYDKNNRNTFDARVLNVRRYYLAQGDFAFRLKVYQKAIEKTLAKEKSIIILVPDLSLIKYFNLNNPIILHANLTKTQRWVAWNKTRSNQRQIIIGSQSALFAPVKNLGLIIIDQEENETYKNDRSPRFHAVEVAYKLSELTGTNLILGSVCPRIETYFNAINRNYRILKQEAQVKSKISIVDMNFEKGILSQTLQEELDSTLKQKRKTVLVLNRKGEGTKFSCVDCGWIALCEKCGLPLTPQKSNLICYRCEKSFPIPQSCSKCHGVQLRPFGMGTKRLAKFIPDFHPTAKIIIIDKENPNPPHEQIWDIAITTSFALKYNFPKISLVGIIDADQGLNFPNFRATEKTFQNFYKFLKIGERGIIQTHMNENSTISALSQLNYKKFFLDEIEKRKKFHFPPFTQLIRLLYTNSDQCLAQKEAQKVYNLLKSFCNNKTAILGPSEPFTIKIRDKFRYQIIIKTTAISFDLRLFLKTLPKNWTIDVDPMDLL